MNSDRLAMLRKAVCSGELIDDQAVVSALRREFNAIKVRIMPLSEQECYLCFEPAAHRHHIVPLCRGGGNGLDNLVALCEPCHVLIDVPLRGAVYGKNWKQKHKRGALSSYSEVVAC